MKILLNIIMPVIMLSALFSNSFAQRKEVIFLKDGSVIEGKIVDSSENKIKIYTKCNCTWVFEKAEIERIENLKNRKYDNTGFANFSTVNLMFGRNDYSLLLSPGLTTVNGFYFLNHFYAGVGVGIEFFDYGSTPLFADFRYFINNKRTSPFVAVQGGYAFPVVFENYYEERYGGINLAGEFGIRHSISENFAFTTSVGFRYQEHISKSLYWYWGDSAYYNSVTTRIYNRVYFKLGFIFG